jgi:predicted DNA-binding protein
VQEKVPEKTNHLTIRIDNETKEAFMNKAKAEGRNASTLISEFIKSYLRDEAQSSTTIAKIQYEIDALKLTVAEIQAELRARHKKSQ